MTNYAKNNNELTNIEQKIKDLLVKRKYFDEIGLINKDLKRIKRKRDFVKFLENNTNYLPSLEYKIDTKFTLYLSYNDTVEKAILKNINNVSRKIDGNCKTIFNGEWK